MRVEQLLAQTQGNVVSADIAAEAAQEDAQLALHQEQQRHKLTHTELVTIKEENEDLKEKATARATTIPDSGKDLDTGSGKSVKSVVDESGTIEF